MTTHTAEQLAEQRGLDRSNGADATVDDETQVHATDGTGDSATDERASPSLPHERDTQSADQRRPYDPQMEQARRDIESGQIDTDLRNTPGLDAPERAQKVPGDAGRPTR